MTNFEMVREFHERFNVPVQQRPQLPSEERRRLRDTLINEENDERMVAEGCDDLVTIADSLTDLLYVIYGTGIEYGIDLDACFAEVHRSNMSKLGADGRPVYRETDQKVLKGPDYSPPDIAGILFGEKS